MFSPPLFQEVPRSIFTDDEAGGLVCRLRTLQMLVVTVSQDQQKLLIIKDLRVPSGCISG